MAVELALGLEKRFGIQLPAMMLNEAPTIERVTGRIVDKLLGGASEAADGQNAPGELVEHLARQHGEGMSSDDVAQTVEDARSLAAKGARLIA